MTYRITKDFEFCAAHRLTGLPEGHKCARLHGHNYVVRVEIKLADVDGVGFVVDYGELAAFKNWLDDWLDHRHLNEVDVLREVNPTAENLARVLHDVVWRVCPVPAGAQVVVSVSETPKTWAVYQP